MKTSKLQNLAKAKIELIKKAAWDDFYVFAKYVCGRELMEEQPHRELCEFLTAGLDKSKQLNLKFTPVITVDYVIKDCKHKLKKLVQLPRGSFKSTVATNAFPVWLMWHNPDLRLMIDSETLGNAKLYLAGIKDMIENNEMLKQICVNDRGEYLLEPNKGIAGGFTEEQVILKHRKKVGLKEPSIFCSGVDNARTGMHPDIIIMDDLVSERNVGTDTQIAKTKDHYRYSLSLLEPDGLQLVIGTRYHMADLYGDLIESDTFDILIRPAIDNKGNLYFPTRLTHDFLNEQKKSQGSYIYHCQYMLNPVDDSNAVFKRNQILYYDKYPTNIITKYIMIDLAISQKETADYFVCMCVGITAEKKIYVLDYDRKRCLPKEQINSIFAMYDKHNKDGKIKAVGIETVAYQKAMVYFIKDEMKRRGVYMPLKELKADKDKFRRIQALQPLFESGDVYMHVSHKDLEQELLEFPVGKHDDMIDSLAYVLQLLRTGNIQVNSKKYEYQPTNALTNY